MPAANKQQSSDEFPLVPACALGSWPVPSSNREQLEYFQVPALELDSQWCCLRDSHCLLLPCHSCGPSDFPEVQTPRLGMMPDVHTRMLWLWLEGRVRDKVLPAPCKMASVSTLRALHPHLLIIIMRFVCFHLNTIHPSTPGFLHIVVLSVISRRCSSSGAEPLTSFVTSLSRSLPLSHLLIHQIPTETPQCVKCHVGRVGKGEGTAALRSSLSDVTDDLLRKLASTSVLRPGTAGYWHTAAKWEKALHSEAQGWVG